MQSDNLLKALTSLEQATENDPVTFVSVGLDALGTAAMAGSMGSAAPGLVKSIKRALADATPPLVDALHGQIPECEVRLGMAMAAELFDADDQTGSERLFVVGLLKLELTRLVIVGEIHARGRRFDMASISTLCRSKIIAEDNRSLN